MLREAHAACTEAAETGAPIDEVADWRSARLPRRQVLMSAGAAALGLGRSGGGGANAPRVIIVGAGLAGLACARTLWRNKGIAATVYEWNTRSGGRVQTLRGYFDGGLTAEQHGQFISSEHVFMRRLAADYGLSLADANRHFDRTYDSGWYNGQRYTALELARDWQDYGWKLFRDAVRAAPSATYRHASATARAWDAMSVTEWVHRYIPGGIDSPLGGLCLADVVSEYGSPPDRQSALNLIYILGKDASAPSGFQPRNTPEVAGTDEKYQVAGGNDRIIDGLVGELPAGAIRLDHRLLAVRQRSDRSFACTFQSPSGTREMTADHVVLTIPPTTLRDVALSGIDLLPVQQRAIAGATLGNNAKIFIQVDGRPWIADGLSGTVLTDEAVCGGWDASNTQHGGLGPHARAIFVGYPGGRPGITLAARYGLSVGDDAGPAPPAMVADTLSQLEPIFPGVTAAWEAGPRLAFVNDGNIDRHLRGAYSNFLVGQYTSFCGGQSLRAGNLHFAGEHTSVAFQGYMEGAVRSGVRAAKEIV
jgi:monoamine oxidase